MPKTLLNYTCFTGTKPIRQVTGPSWRFCTNGMFTHNMWMSFTSFYERLSVYSKQYDPMIYSSEIIDRQILFFGLNCLNLHSKLFSTLASPSSSLETPPGISYKLRTGLANLTTTNQNGNFSCFLPLVYI